MERIVFPEKFHQENAQDAEEQHDGISDACTSEPFHIGNVGYAFAQHVELDDNKAVVDDMEQGSKDYAVCLAVDDAEQDTKRQCIKTLGEVEVNGAEGQC